MIQVLNTKLGKFQKIRKGSLYCSHISQITKIPDNILTKVLNSPDYLEFLFNCRRNLPCKTRKISASSKDTTSNQIKGNKQLSDLAQFGQLPSDKARLKMN